MTTRRAACSCGQLHLTIEGEPSRISMCHCLECQRRTGGVISNQARFRREQVTFAGKATAWMRTAESGNVLTFHYLSDVRLHRLLGGRRLSWIRGRCHWHIRRPEFSRADHRGVGGNDATPGFPCRPTRRPSAWRSRGDDRRSINSIGVDFAVSAACPLRVKSRHVQRTSRRPLYTQKRTCAAQLGMSALRQ